MLVRLSELVSTEELSELSRTPSGNGNWREILPHSEGCYVFLWLYFVTLTEGFVDLLGYSWVLLALVKAVSSLFIMQQNNGESRDHMGAVMIFPNENWCVPDNASNCK